MADVGRPPAVTPDVLRKLEDAFSIGCTDLEACIYANISKTTLYKYQQEHPEFAERKEALKEKPVLKARTALFQGLDDPDRAFKFLTVKKKDEFSPRIETTGANGEPLDQGTSERLDALTNILNDLHKEGRIPSDGEPTIPLDSQAQNKERDGTTA